MMTFEREREKLRILRELDVDAALRLSAYKPPGGVNEVFGGFDDQRKVALAGLHKARLMISEREKGLFTKDQLEDSLLWLLEHGFKQEISDKRKK